MLESRVRDAFCITYGLIHQGRAWSMPREPPPRGLTLKGVLITRQVKGCLPHPSQISDSSTRPPQAAASISNKPSILFTPLSSGGTDFERRELAASN